MHLLHWHSMTIIPFHCGKLTWLVMWNDATVEFCFFVGVILFVSTIDMPVVSHVRCCWAHTHQLGQGKWGMMMKKRVWSTFFYIFSLGLNSMLSCVQSPFLTEKLTSFYTGRMGPTRHCVCGSSGGRYICSFYVVVAFLWNWRRRNTTTIVCVCVKVGKKNYQIEKRRRDRVQLMENDNFDSIKE